ncbi:MAG: hypothetical protein R3B40_30920, partial [Polyangiales bacterium]
DRLAHTPEGGAAMFVVALLMYAEDATLGMAALTVAIDREHLQEGAGGYKGLVPGRADVQAFTERNGGKPHIARSYLVGTSPEHGYALPIGPLTVRVRDQQVPGESVGDVAKRFVHCSGADSPRPIGLRRNNRGLFKATSWSSLQVGVRAPVETVDDDL